MLIKCHPNVIENLIHVFFFFLDQTCLDNLYGQTLTNKEGNISVTVTQFKPPSSSLNQQEVSRAEHLLCY